VEYGLRDEILFHPRHPYPVALLKAIPRGKGNENELYTIRDTVPQVGNMPPGCRFAPRCDHALPRCREVMPPETREGEHRVYCWRYEAV
jgi:oligopeptide/dipeptide ABC transporter ATP-binding protein